MTRYIEKGIQQPVTMTKKEAIEQRYSLGKSFLFSLKCNFLPMPRTQNVE